MKESLKLLFRRESSEVLGRRKVNLWMLTCVIAATFISVAFSNASMEYLTDKMNDPFTNWINIKYQNEIPAEVLTDMGCDDTRSRFRIKDFQTDYTDDKVFRVADDSSSAFMGMRFVDKMNGDVVKAILDKENLATDIPVPDSIPDNTFGLIITAEALANLGYDKADVPSFIMMHSYSNEGADTLGFDLIEGKFARQPLPILAVVNRLPDNLDALSSAFFQEQEASPSLNMCNEDYARSLIYFVPEELAERFVAEVPNLLPASMLPSHEVKGVDPEMEYMRPAAPGRFYRIMVWDDEIPTSDYIAAAKAIADSEFGDKVTRTFSFDFMGNPQSFKQYLSVNFERLDSIRSFEQYMKQQYGIKIDMAQVNSKENFNAVSLLASVLSWAMILFSIVCIILFIVNMLQSYFQKVKRNMGTFKAFGISTGELISVYVCLIFSIVVVAIVIALAFVWIVQGALPLLGFMRDGRYPWLDLWTLKTGISVAVMMAATVLTVYVVMKSLLKSSPGDLIYDR